MKAIIVEDEKNNCELLKLLVDRYLSDQVEIIATYKTCKEAIKGTLELKPQLVFLDVQLPDGNAFYYLDEVKSLHFNIIFTTAFDQYTLKAFKYNSIDYLIKPITKDDLMHAFNKIKSLQLSNQNTQMSSFSAAYQSGTMIQKITVYTKDGYNVIDINDIIKIEANGAYAIIYSQKEKEIISSKSLGYYEDLLPEEIFCRIHHKWLVNLNKVKKLYSNDGKYLLLEDQSQVEISARKFSWVKERLVL